MSADAVRSPTPVPVARVLDALRDAGLLVAQAEAVPATITDLVDDSRRVTPGSAFLAVKGAAQDGHAWLPAAADRGATLALVEDADAAMSAGVPWVQVRDGRRAAAIAAAAFYDWPARALTLVGVTGTNGKTTTVGLLRHLLDAPGHPAASIGTLGVLLGSAGAPLPGGFGLTTPGPVELQRLLRTLVDRGVKAVAMETSSHALDQRRVEGLSFAAAVFTNLTRDHLDYHGTMEAYRAAKLRLVGLLARDGVAVFNADDPAWRGVTNAPRAIIFGTERGADVAVDVTARDLAYVSDGSRFLLVTPTGAQHVALPLIGDFNVANALAAAAAALALGMSVTDIAQKLSQAPQVPGRLERLSTAPTVLRDYAHTPDALERALQAVRPFTRAPGAEAAGRLIVLFGCGGDRDRGKRPEMGRIAEALADVVIVTSDNPRTEDPERILDDIEAGMTRHEHLRIADRFDAIRRALQVAKPGDVVVLAGKGHETYQIRGTTSYPFDEQVIVQELRAAMAASGRVVNGESGA
ncbi:MAG: UDP-N-acetylmuramoyl-L-alanyl-D-glutamate--2,6-diaminopimelate ligase [Gemmatimonas sp.]|jgi:UDP-N-acetylmuramoyl-L-alanyl-D-glutamate--2,6-diaminopimelate ligase|uniref:UDP-N-acetylmuramoyl-L-alanyl-D-glutamate--2, 6-diaminopimelate ligase n=1 Tax=Gemmatimonas sp. TaxID=1962908 RepID=UPI00391F0650|nr:UDP-N-acetylmuramoyl-L-alanyl-D-glutamate--2,6-diaminopimelate ligase [Gemmatimonadota bacterium]